MSPLFANRFTAHMPEGDPRGPLTASAGCVWPTVPAWNLLVVSDNATGVLAFLNTLGIQLKPHATQREWDDFRWSLNGGIPPVVNPELMKTLLLDPYGYRLTFTATTIWGILFSVTDFAERVCNCCHMLTPGSVGFPVVLGETGDSFRLLQVEYDETRPPGGWPP